MRAEASGEDDDKGIAEIERYVAATRHGFEAIRTPPLSHRFVCKVHEVQLRSVRDGEELPGQFRTSPVWVGSTTDGPETVTFGPPLPEPFDDWERFLNEPSRRPLTQAALMHYQFETVHPFLDDNGRVGRLLIGLLLSETGQLTSPLLPSRATWKLLDGSTTTASGGPRAR